MSTFTYNDENFPLPSGSWKDRTPVDMYDDIEKIDNEIPNDDDQAESYFKKHGFLNRDHFDAYRGHITDKIDWTEYGQKKMTEAVNAQKKQMADTVASMAGQEILQPIAGISLEKYAHLCAAMSQGADMRDLLKKNGIETVSWEKAQEGWNERMRTDSTFTVTTEYSRYFMAAGQGQFGDVAKDIAGAMGGGTSSAKNPVSLEKYAEILAAQGAAVAQGKDASAVLATYGMNAADWGTVGIHWTNQMMTDLKVGMKFSELYTKFTEKFASETPGVADDINF